jgi:carboxymethylenebutenolidase
MTATRITQAMIDLYDRFTHGDGSASRRDLIAGLARLAGGVAAATAVLPMIEARAAAATLIDPADPRLVAADVRFPGAAGRAMAGYLVHPAKGAAGLPRALVIHENRGLTGHIRDVTRRLALAGFVALAPDFLAPLGGTPAAADGADDIARTMIGKLDRDAAVADGVAALAWLVAQPQGKGAPGAVGFCWGGGMVNALAVAAGGALRAGVAYYGPAPDAAGAARIKARMLLHYAGLDDRINAGGPAWQAALQAAGVRYEAQTYAGVNHAFNNDTSEARYDKAAADLAWWRTLAWLK